MEHIAVKPMIEAKSVKGCWMRFQYFNNPRTEPGKLHTVDRWFYGLDDAGLKLNIDYWIQKYGIAKAFVIPPQEAERLYGDQSTQISTEETQEEVEEKGQTVSTLFST
jgi:hypothetical protein